MSTGRRRARSARGERAGVDTFIEEAERGYDVEAILRRRRGRPALGEGPSSVESVRLEPELKRKLIVKAGERGVSVSEAIREALRAFVAT